MAVVKRLMILSYVYVNKFKTPINVTTVFTADHPKVVSKKLKDLKSEFKKVKTQFILKNSIKIIPVPFSLILDSGNITASRMGDLVNQYIGEYEAKGLLGKYRDFDKEHFMLHVRDRFEAFFTDIENSLIFDGTGKLTQVKIDVKQLIPGDVIVEQAEIAATNKKL